LSSPTPPAVIHADICLKIISHTFFDDNSEITAFQSQTGFYGLLENARICVLKVGSANGKMDIYSGYYKLNASTP
jgi:hypothetical protein